MEYTLTITHLDTETTTWIEQEALRTGTSIETIIRKFICPIIGSFADRDSKE